MPLPLRRIMVVMTRSTRRLIAEIQTSEKASPGINELQKLELECWKTMCLQVFREFRTFFLSECTIETDSNHIDTIRRNDPFWRSRNSDIRVLT